MQVDRIRRLRNQIVAHVQQRIAEGPDAGTGPFVHVQAPNARRDFQIHQHGHRGRGGTQRRRNAQGGPVGIEVQPADERRQRHLVAADPDRIAVAHARDPVDGIRSQHEGRAIGAGSETGLGRPPRIEIEGPGHGALVVGPCGIVAVGQISDDGDPPVGPPGSAGTIQLQDAAADLDVAVGRSREHREPFLADVVGHVRPAEIVQRHGNRGTGRIGSEIGLRRQPDAIGTGDRHPHAVLAQDRREEMRDGRGDHLAGSAPDDHRLDGLERRIGQRHRAAGIDQIERASRRGHAGKMVDGERRRGHSAAQGTVGDFIGQSGLIRHLERQQFGQLGGGIEAFPARRDFQIGIVRGVVVQDHDHVVGAPDDRRIGHRAGEAAARRNGSRGGQRREVGAASAGELDGGNIQRRGAAVGHRQGQIGRGVGIHDAEIQRFRKHTDGRQSPRRDGRRAGIGTGANPVPLRPDAEIVEGDRRQIRHRLEGAGNQAVGVARHVIARIERRGRGDVQAVSEAAIDLGPAGNERGGIGGLDAQPRRRHRETSVHGRDGGIDLRIRHLDAGERGLVDDLRVQRRIVDPNLELDAHGLFRFEQEPGNQIRRRAARRDLVDPTGARDQHVVDPQDVGAVHAGGADKTNGGRRGNPGRDIAAVMDIVGIGRRALEPGEFRPGAREAVGGNLEGDVFPGFQTDALIVELQPRGGINRQIRHAADVLAAAGEAQRIGFIDAVVELDLDGTGRGPVVFAFHPVPGPGFRAVVVGIHAAAELIAEGLVDRNGSVHPATVGHVDRSQRQRIDQRHAGLVHAAAVGDRQRIGNRISGPDRSGGSRGLDEIQHGFAGADDDLGGIVSSDGIHLIHGRDGRHVGDGRAGGIGFHHGREVQRGDLQRRQRPDRPKPAAAVVGPLLRHVRQVGHAGRQEIRHGHPRGRIRSEVGRRNRIDQLAVFGGSGRRRRFAEPDVHADHLDHGLRRIVGRQQVRHVGAGNPRPVGDGSTGSPFVYRGGDLQFRSRPHVERTHVPNARQTVVGALARRMGRVGQPIGQGFRHPNAGGVGRPRIGQHEGIRHRVAFVRALIVHGLGQPEVGMANPVDHLGGHRNRLLVAGHRCDVEQLGHRSGIDDQGLESDRQRLAGGQRAVRRQQRRVVARQRDGSGPRNPGAVGHVERARRKQIADLDPRMRQAAQVGNRNGIGDDVARSGVIHHVGRFNDLQSADGDSGGIFVVGGDGIRQVRGGNAAAVRQDGSEGAGVDFRGQRQDGHRADVEGTHAPHARAVVVRALAGRIRHVAQPIGQRFGHLDAGDGRWPRIGQADRVFHRGGFVRRGIVDRLDQPQIGPFDQHHDAGLVVGGLRVHLVGGGDRRHVGPAESTRAGGSRDVHRKHRGGSRRQGAHGPHPQTRIIGALAGGRGVQIETGRKHVGDVHARRFFLRAQVGDGQREPHSLAFSDRGGARLLFDRQIGVDHGIHHRGRHWDELLAAGRLGGVGDGHQCERIVHLHFKGRHQALSRRQGPVRGQIRRLADVTRRNVGNPHESIGAAAAVAVGGAVGFAAGTAAAIGRAPGAGQSIGHAVGAIAAVERRSRSPHAVGGGIAAVAAGAGSAAAGSGSIGGYRRIIPPAAMPAAIDRVAHAQGNGTRAP